MKTTELNSDAEDWDFDAIEAFMDTSQEAFDHWQQASLKSSIWEEIEI